MTLMRRAALLAASLLIAAVLCLPVFAATVTDNAPSASVTADDGEVNVIDVSDGANDNADELDVIDVSSEEPTAESETEHNVIDVSGSVADNAEEHNIIDVSGERPDGSTRPIVDVTPYDVASVDTSGYQGISYEDYSGDYDFWGYDHNYGFDLYADEYGDGEPGYADYSGYENYGDYQYGTDDGYDEQAAALAQSVGFGDLEGVGAGSYDDYYAVTGEAQPRTGTNPLAALISFVVSSLVGGTFYGSTNSAYKNAGIGVVYDLKDNAVLSKGGNADRQTGTRSNVQRGYYGRGGVISAGTPGLSAGPNLSAKPMSGGVNVTMRPSRPGAPNMQGRPPQRPPQGGPPQSGKR